MQTTTRVLAILLLATAPTGLVASPAEAAPASAAPIITVLHAAAASTTPSSDALPVLLDSVPITLSPKAARSVKPGSGGRFTVHVDKAGKVVDLQFDATTSPGVLAQPVRRALAQWQFAPFTKNGRPHAVHLPLVYVATPAPKALEEASLRAPPPVPIFRIHPSRTPSFLRSTAGTPRMMRAPDQFRMTTTTVMSVGPDGRPRTTVLPRMEMTQGWFEAAVDPSAPVPWISAGVDLSFEIDATGVPVTFTVHDSTCPQLEPETVAALRSSRFLPPTIEGKPVRSRIREQVVFPMRKDLKPPVLVLPPDDARWDTTPAITVYALPVFPTALVSAQIEGEARVRVHLDENGSIRSVDSLGATREEFGHAMRAAMFATSWAPAQRGGASVACVFDVEARFSLAPEKMAFEENRLSAAVLAYTGASEPLRAEALDQTPQLLTGRQPRNDGIAAAAHATLEITIDQTGRVRDPVVASASHVAFGYAAVHAASTWLFEPPTRDGSPVAVRVRVPLSARESSPGES